MNPAVVRAAMPTAYVIVAIGSESDPAAPEDVETILELVEATGLKAFAVTDLAVRFGITKRLAEDLGLDEQYADFYSYRSLDPGPL